MTAQRIEVNSILWLDAARTRRWREVTGCDQEFRGVRPRTAASAPNQSSFSWPLGRLDVTAASDTRHGDLCEALPPCSQAMLMVRYRHLTITLPVEALAAKHPPQHLSGTKGVPIGHSPEGKR